MNSNRPTEYETEETEPTIASEPAIAYNYSQNMPLQGLLEYLYATLSPNNMEWLGEHLIEHAKTQNEDLKPYTMEEINEMLDEAERDFEAGRCYSTEQVLQMCRAQTKKQMA